MTPTSLPNALAATTVAIVVHYGDPALTARSVRSIGQGSVRPGLLIVVDNGPEPITAQELAGLDLHYRVIRPGRNVGFAAAVNMAFAEAPNFSWVWLLNNDAEAAPTAFAELLDAAARLDGPGLISSLIKDAETHEIWFERARFYPWRLESNHVPTTDAITDHAIDPGRPSIFGVPYLPGCSLLFAAEIGSPAGLLDPSYFVYGEDIDLALRAIDRGWPLSVARRSVVMHRPASGATAQDRERLLAESAVRIVRRRFPLLLPLSLGGGIFLGILRALLQRRLQLMTARLSGYLAGLRTSASTGAPREDIPQGVDPRPEKSTVAAVIVTYHPQPGFAERIRNLAAQVGAVLIVDNASTPDEVEEIRAAVGGVSAEIIQNSVNVGLATALNQGVRWSAERGYAWALTLDQDTIAGPHLLGEAARVFDAFRADHPAVIGARAHADQMARSSTAPGRQTPVVITAGALNSVAAWRAVGGFRDDFFIDSVDSEYCLRARSRGYGVLIANTPTITHMIGQPSRHQTSIRAFWTSNHDRRRRYYITRNRIITWRRYAMREPRYVLYEIRETAKDLIKLCLVEDDRGGKLAAVARGLFDGLRGVGGEIPR